MNEAGWHFFLHKKTKINDKKKSLFLVSHLKHKTNR
jgi:hypothetical protein